MEIPSGPLTGCGITAGGFCGLKLRPIVAHDESIGGQLSGFGMQRHLEAVCQSRLQETLVSDPALLQALLDTHATGRLVIFDTHVRRFVILRTDFEIEWCGLDPIRTSDDLVGLDAVGLLNERLQGRVHRFESGGRVHHSHSMGLAAGVRI